MQNLYRKVDPFIHKDFKQSEANEFILQYVN